jgi:hypothetical protein
LSVGKPRRHKETEGDISHVTCEGVGKCGRKGAFLDWDIKWHHAAFVAEKFFDLTGHKHSPVQHETSWNIKGIIVNFTFENKKDSIQV